MLLSNLGRMHSGLSKYNELEDAVEGICYFGKIGCAPSQVALNWGRGQSGVIVPVVGARTLEQIQENLGCLEIELSAEHHRSLSEASAVAMGYPYDFVSIERVRRGLYGDTMDELDKHYLPWGGMPGVAVVTWASLGGGVRLQARDIMGYTFAAMLWSFLIFAVCVTWVPV